jgi:hypothetical protein
MDMGEKSPAKRRKQTQDILIRLHDLDDSIGELKFLVNATHNRITDMKLGYRDNDVNTQLFLEDMELVADVLLAKIRKVREIS